MVLDYIPVLKYSIVDYWNWTSTSWNILLFIDLVLRVSINQFRIYYLCQWFRNNRDFSIMILWYSFPTLQSSSRLLRWLYCLFVIKLTFHFCLRFSKFHTYPHISWRCPNSFEVMYSHLSQRIHVILITAEADVIHCWSWNPIWHYNHVSYYACNFKNSHKDYMKYSKNMLSWNISYD